MGDWLTNIIIWFWKISGRSRSSIPFLFLNRLYQVLAFREPPVCILKPKGSLQRVYLMLLHQDFSWWFLNAFSRMKTQFATRLTKPCDLALHLPQLRDYHTPYPFYCGHQLYWHCPSSGSLKEVYTLPHNLCTCCFFYPEHSYTSLLPFHGHPFC